MKIKSREDYIAKVNGPRSFPWRIAVVSDKDIDIANSNLSYLLAAPSKVADTSWIKPGKVAWEWWNCWNIDGVDFNTGVNNATYKAYIDFAGRNGIEYVILDEGWAVNRKADLMQVVPEIDLKGLIAYAAEKSRKTNQPINIKDVK
jgi:alpha-glucosidase